jgi:hypothetical protein
MYAPVITIATLELFAPLLAAALAALGLSVLSRRVSERKYVKALADVGGPWMPLHAYITKTPLSVATVPALDFQGYVNRLSSEDSSARKPVKLPELSSEDSAATTQVVNRVYLDDRDMIEC